MSVKGLMISTEECVPFTGEAGGKAQCFVGIVVELYLRGGATSAGSVVRNAMLILCARGPRMVDMVVQVWVVWAGRRWGRKVSVVSEFMALYTVDRGLKMTCNHNDHVSWWFKLRCGLLSSAYAGPYRLLLLFVSGLRRSDNVLVDVLLTGA